MARKSSEGSRAADEASPREGQFIPPVGPSTSKTNPNRRNSAPRHAAPEEPAPPRKPRKRATPAAPTSSARGPAASRIGVPGGASRLARRGRAAAQEARTYADRAAYRQAHQKPTVTGRAASGAAAGAAAGAAVGGPPGAAVGGILGGAGGAIGGARAKKAYRAATSTNGHVRRVLVGEFLICLVIIGLSPLTDRRRDEPPGTWMKRMTAVLGLFFVLGLISAAPGGAAVAAGLGGLVAVTLIVSERDVFTAIATAINADSAQPVGPGPGDDDLVGGAEGSNPVTPILPTGTGVGGAENPGDVTPIGGPGGGPAYVGSTSPWR